MKTISEEVIKEAREHYFLSAEGVQPEQSRLFGQAWPLKNARELASFRQVYSAINFLQKTGFDPANQETEFDYPDYGGIPKKYAMYLLSDEVNAIQDALYCLAELKNPSREVWLKTALKKGAELGCFAEPPAESAPKPRRKIK